MQIFVKTKDGKTITLGDDKAASVLSRIMPGQGSKGLEILKWMDARSIADMISTGMIESKVHSFDDIINEIAAARVTERGSRADDKASEAAMEDRKKAGYF